MMIFFNIMGWLFIALAFSEAISDLRKGRPRSDWPGTVISAAVFYTSCAFIAILMMVWNFSQYWRA